MLNIRNKAMFLSRKIYALIIGVAALMGAILGYQYLNKNTKLLHEMKHFKSYAKREGKIKKLVEFYDRGKNKTNKSFVDF